MVACFLFVISMLRLAKGLPFLNSAWLKVRFIQVVGEEFLSDHATICRSSTLCCNGLREVVARIGSAGVVRREAVEISPLRRVKHAIYLLITGAECLVDGCLQIDYPH